MVSDCSASLDDRVQVVQKKSGCRTSFNKKDGTKVLSKVNKAQREKLKRDRMNDLFSELGKALEPANQKNGKSSTLTNTIRIIQDLSAQVEALEKENSTLLAESQYVAVEKSELEEENNAIEAQISKLKAQIKERVHSQSLCRSDPSPQLNPDMMQCATQKTPVMGHVFVVPLQNDPKVYPEPEFQAAQLPPNVSKPHARYPSPSHTWSFSFLSEQEEQVSK